MSEDTPAGNQPPAPSLKPGSATAPTARQANDVANFSNTTAVTAFDGNSAPKDEHASPTAPATPAEMPGNQRDAARNLEWDTREKIAGVFSKSIIPLVLVVIAYYVQGELASKNAQHEYVKLAISLLRVPDDDLDPHLREWSVDLLADNAPTKPNAEALTALRQAGAFPLANPKFDKGGAPFAFIDDILITGHPDGRVMRWDYSTGRPREPALLMRGESSVIGIGVSWERSGVIISFKDGSFYHIGSSGVAEKLQDIG